MSEGDTVECKNTDREIWRERGGDYYADSIFVTERGGVEINCGGTVYVKPIREWHRLAGGPYQGLSQGGISDRLSNFDDWGDRIREPS